MKLLLPVLAFLLAAPGAAAGGPGKPADLRVEYQGRALGLETGAPRFSWLVNDEERSALQAAYQVLVSADLESLKEGRRTVWDSGRVQSDRSIHVVYGGPPLERRK